MNIKPKSYAFDLDENIIFTGDKVLLEKYCDKEGTKEIVEICGTELYDVLDKGGYSYINGDKNKSLFFFDNDKALLLSTKRAYENGDFGASFNAFKEATINADPISIITARSHGIKVFEKIHKNFIKDCLDEEQLKDFETNFLNKIGEKGNGLSLDELIDMYIKRNSYFPCSNLELLGKEGLTMNQSLEERKAHFFEKFIQQSLENHKEYYGEQLIETNGIKVGFSDDKKENVESVKSKIVSCLKEKYKNVDFSIYTAHTKNDIIKEKL